MRIPNRWKRTVYISNLIPNGQGQYDDPKPIKALFFPKGELSFYGGGVNGQGNTDELHFESKVKLARTITQDTKIWINRKPNANGTDPTHRVKGRSGDLTGGFIVINCESTTVNVPIV